MAPEFQKKKKIAQMLLYFPGRERHDNLRTTRGHHALPTPFSINGTLSHIFHGTGVSFRDVYAEEIGPDGTCENHSDRHSTDPGRGNMFFTAFYDNTKQGASG